MLSVLRPDSEQLPLFLHVAGATVLVGGLVVAGGAQALGWRPGDAARWFARLGLLALLAVAIPGYALMRGAGEWLASEQGLRDADDRPGWLETGYAIADGGLLVLLAATILAGLSARRGGGDRLGRVAAVLSFVVLAAFLVSAWTMSTKR